MIITAISDLHGEQPDLEEGDILIIAGDCTTNDSLPSWVRFSNWLVSLPFKKKILIGGNHDNFLESFGTRSIYEDTGLLEGVTYLCDSGCEYEGLKFWGCPYTPLFSGCNPKCQAFMCRNDQLEAHYDLIPEGLDYLITHGPPYRILDTSRWGDHCGSYELYRTIIYKKPKNCIFGHIHEGHGTQSIFFTEGDVRVTKLYNVAIMDDSYDPTHKPTIVE